ncbi:hypothetical protein OPKNFCMD_0222 [Methylobacterium crusticola]|uniref:Uncharacterized protein n=1 Tax=Methylobacterium crusticola TaxID=1697972 RepID=A0ABQ4QR77_9HYPH|nr:hypothetical protein [Methylobacterium crusticola]GJD47514.1 hypothetical protein OPKNFCMD_0222 [Methylobacterium crusticola]
MHRKLPPGTGSPEDFEKDLSFTETMARAEWDHRKRLSASILSAFTRVNIGILLIVCIMYGVDTWVAVSSDKPDLQRTIDAKVVMTLIGATTVQFGAISLGVSNWLFPKGK